MHSSPTNTLQPSATVMLQALVKVAFLPKYIIELLPSIKFARVFSEHINAVELLALKSKFTFLTLIPVSIKIKLFCPPKLMRYDL